MPLDFRPLPWLSHPHLQTILGHWWPVRLPLLRGKPHTFTLSDGDRLVLHWNQPRIHSSAQPLAVMVHGMGGSARSRYMQRVAQRFLNEGCQVVRVDLRGCGEGVALSRRPAHGGCSGDLIELLEAMSARYPHAPMLLIGFSLGGNIVLKAAAELADRPISQLRAVAAVNAPVDMDACSQLLEQPRNRLYERFFIRDLWRQAKARQRHFPDQPAPPWAAMTRLRAFDDHYTAPLNGFRDATEYYARASSFPLIPAIQMPSLILTARDDPFIDVGPYETLPNRPPLDIQIVPHGGHLGFLGSDGRGGIRWMERHVVRWLMAQLGR